MDEYSFIGEVQVFDLNKYTPHLGWINGNPAPFKIYTLDGNPFYYLYDEGGDRLIRFSALHPELLRSKEEYEKVVRMFMKTGFFQP